ncbi:MAG: hypothetical protein SGI97_01850 [candidate division Zixibacteria bacterium]|nr:hypothetical protein [candidate division Zixibacteria bacterium]
MPIDFLYSNIGRGHAFYLDEIIEALKSGSNLQSVGEVRDVFTVSHGTSRLAWRFARVLYTRGSSGGVLGKVYSKLRKSSDYNNPNSALKVLSRDIVAQYRDSSTPLVVDHPILVGILKGRKNTIYQHGELVVPDEACVRGASLVIVPTAECAQRFIDAGYDLSSVLVSGLCIELSLVKQAKGAFTRRIERIKNTEYLSGGFFSSGAEPKQHVHSLIAAVESSVAAGGRAILFATGGGQLEKAALKTFGSRVKVIHGSSEEEHNIDSTLAEKETLVLAIYTTRQEENELVASMFPYLDYFVAPSHERTNWSIGLGLPIFMLEPSIGSFAPLNRALAEARGVGIAINQTAAPDFGSMLADFRQSGRLLEMSQNGWGRDRIDGFSCIAQSLTKRHT